MILRPPRGVTALKGVGVEAQGKEISFKVKVRLSNLVLSVFNDFFFKNLLELLIQILQK